MGSGGLSFSFILVLIFGASLFKHPFAESRELRQETVCYDEAVRLDCGNRSFVAIHEARYLSDVPCPATTTTEDYDEEEEEDEEEAGPGTRNLSSCEEDVRISINRMCSGNRFCSYNYSKEPESDRLCTTRGGVLIVRYDCVRDNSLINYCNKRLDQKEGYISSPGYNMYYMQLSACEWIVEAQEGQTILLKVLHLQTRPATPVLGPSSAPLLDQENMYALGHLPAYSEPPTRCEDDLLQVLAGTQEVLAACGEGLQALQHHVRADGAEGVTVRFRSADLAPLGGFLAYYKIEGCPSLATPEGSYLLERNGSSALFACQDQTVFNDTLEPTRFLQCVRDHHWNDTLPPCITEKVIEDTTTIISNKNIQEEEEEEPEEMEYFTTQTIEMTSSAVQLGPSYLEDILLPSIIIGVLLVGNAVILMIILFIRRRQKAKLKEEGEEFEEQKPQNPVNDTAFTTV